MGPAGLKLVERIARKAPNGLARNLALYAFDEFDQAFLILGFHGFAAQNREAIAKRRAQALDYLGLHRLIKRLACVEAPCLAVEAIRAMSAAPRHEQRRANAFAVRDVEIFDGRVVHETPSRDGARSCDSDRFRTSRTALDVLFARART